MLLLIYLTYEIGRTGWGLRQAIRLMLPCLRVGQSGSFENVMVRFRCGVPVRSERDSRREIRSDIPPRAYINLADFSKKLFNNIIPIMIQIILFGVDPVSRWCGLVSLLALEFWTQQSIGIT